MSFVWTVTPDAAWSALAADYARRIEAGAIAIAQEFAPIIQTYMNESIPWHVGEGDTHTADEPNDMLSYVQAIVNQAVIVYLTHDAMLTPEKSLEAELSYVPPALDIFGPQIMDAVVRMFA